MCDCTSIGNIIQARIAFNVSNEKHVNGRIRGGELLHSANLLLQDTLQSLINKCCLNYGTAISGSQIQLVRAITAAELNAYNKNTRKAEKTKREAATGRGSRWK